MRSAFFTLAGGALVATLIAVSLPARASQLSFLRVEDGRLVDEQGQTVVLRGCNLGNWLLIEPWMLGIDSGQIPDQQTLFDILRSRFGDAEGERLMDVYRASFITQRDFDLIKTFGFNAVRIPFDHELVENLSDDFALRDDAFEWLDAAMAMAEQAGLYIIWDMHGAPGGQSLDQPSGDRTQNELWSDDNAQERMAWIWQHIARRYKNRPAFAAYDVLNEPFGDFSADLRDDIVSVVDRSYDAIREIDPERPIFMPAALQGVSFYGDPGSHGWTGVGYTEHFYPGIFDSKPPTLQTHSEFLDGVLAGRDAFLTDVGAPYLIGEFNPIWEHVGGAAMTRRYFDTAESLGFSATLWSYKILKGQAGAFDNNWYMVSNGQPFTLNPRTDSKAQIEAKFASLATMPLAVDNELLGALTSIPAPALNLPDIDAPLAAPLADDPLAGWTMTNLGDAPPGALSVTSPSEFTLYASGSDLFSTSDSAQLLTQPWNGNVFVRAVIERFDAGATYGKAGLTLRASTGADAAHVTINVTPDGRVSATWRPSTKASTQQQTLGVRAFPIGLVIARQGGQIRMWMTDVDGNWEHFPFNESVSLPGTLEAGVVAASNTRGLYGAARLSQVSVGSSQPAMPNIPPIAGTNLLSNASFETSAGPFSPSLPGGWTIEGSHVTRETGWTPLRSGDAVLAYRHWEAGGSGTESISQDISGLVPGQRYVLAAYASIDDVSGNVPDAFELQIEDVSSGELLIVTKTSIAVSEMTPGPEFSRVELPFRATGGSARVRMRFVPSDGGNDGALKIDDVVLYAAP